MIKRILEGVGRECSKFTIMKESFCVCSQGSYSCGEFVHRDDFGTGVSLQEVETRPLSLEFRRLYLVLLSEREHSYSLGFINLIVY